MTEPVFDILDAESCCLCESTDRRRFVLDHCHDHGDSRGVICISCNGLMRVIDGLVRPRQIHVPIVALLAHKARCQECPQMAESALARSWWDIHRPTWITRREWVEVVWPQKELERLELTQQAGLLYQQSQADAVT